MPSLSSFEGILDPSVLQENAPQPQEERDSFITNLVTILDRYELVVRHEYDGLTLTDGERGLIAEVLATTPLGMSTLLSLDSEIIEAMRSRELVQRWNVSPQNLAKKLRDLSPAQKLAVVEAFERGYLQDPERMVKVFGRTESKTDIFVFKKLGRFLYRLGLPVFLRG